MRYTYEEPKNENIRYPDKALGQEEEESIY